MLDDTLVSFISDFYLSLVLPMKFDEIRVCMGELDKEETSPSNLCYCLYLVDMFN